MYYYISFRQNAKQKNNAQQTTQLIVAAVVAVLLFHSHYNQDGVGMMVAAAASGGGGEEEKAAMMTTPRGTMMTKAVVDVVPVPTRKLSKISKAFKPDTDEDVMQSLLRAGCAPLDAATTILGGGCP